MTGLGVGGQGTSRFYAQDAQAVGLIECSPRRGVGTPREQECPRTPPAAQPAPLRAPGRLPRPRAPPPGLVPGGRSQGDYAAIWLVSRDRYHGGQYHTSTA